MRKNRSFRTRMAVICASSMLLGMTAASFGEEVTRTGSAPGVYGDDVVVEVTASPDEIISVEVTDHNETDGIGTVAVETIPGDIVASQSLDVDDISGATMTSRAIKQAVSAALEEAGIDPAAFGGEAGESIAEVSTEAEDNESAAEDTTETAAGGTEYDADVVVVGAGGAGMTAAIEAADAGMNVIVVESQPMVGGNSIRSTGGLNAAKTLWQDENEFGEEAGVEKQLAAAEESWSDDDRITKLAGEVKEQWEKYRENQEGYFDSKELFELDTLIGGKGRNDMDLVETLVGNSADAIDWLDSIGAHLNNVSSFGGASVKRIHRPVDEEGKVIPVGSYIVPILEENLKERGIEVLLNTTATAVMMDDDAAAGIEAEGENGEKITIRADAVVLATGGFGANLEKVVELKPELAGFMTTNAPGALGQGIEIAQAVGADTVDMDQIQIHPTVEANTAALITEGLRGDGAILVNQEGERFTDEVGTRDAVSAAEIAQTGSYSYLIVDQAMADASAVIQGYISKGFTVQGETYEELAKALEIDPETFARTMNDWNECVKAKEDKQFGRTSFAAPLDSAPYYAIKVTAGIHHTMGGLKIDPQAEVIDTQGNPIDGLFAAGEVTGGVHGANRLGGNAVADFVVFGRIAGQNAAAYAAEAAAEDEAA